MGRQLSAGEPTRTEKLARAITMYTGADQVAAEELAALIMTMENNIAGMATQLVEELEMVLRGEAA